MQNYTTLAELATRADQILGISDWVLIDQDRINLFADATSDHQWIHIDPAKASTGPYGSTIAHGYLTLGLVPAFLATAFSINDARFNVNYGLNRTRFTSPVPVDSRLRCTFKLIRYEPFVGGALLHLDAVICREGQDKAVCFAEILLRCHTA